MLVKEILERTMKIKLEDVAKEAKIPYRKLSATLKKIECEPLGKGKRGWIFKGNDELILEQSIYSFVDTSNRKTNNKITSNNASVKNSNNVNNDDNKNNNKENKNMVSEIQALIKGKNKDENARIYKGIYFDKDIAHFLDNVQHGNKSEIVNKIMRQYLMDNELM